MARRTIALTVPIALAAVLVAGGTTAVAATKPSRAALTLRVTSKQLVSAPTTTQPGLAELRNTSSHSIVLVTPRHGASKAAFVHDLKASSSTALTRDFTIADLLPAKATTYLQLNRGTYYLADGDRDTYTAASVATLHVTGSTANATAPKAKPVTLSTHNTLSAPATLPTSSQLQFVNHSAKLIGFWLWPVAKSVTASALQAFLAKPSFAGLVSIASSTSSGPGTPALLSPGRSALSSQRSARGRYLLLAIAPSESTPKLTSGTTRLITVK